MEVMSENIYDSGDENFDYDKEDAQKNLKHDLDIISSDEGLIFNPYNSQNREITIKEVENILPCMCPIKFVIYCIKELIHKSY